MTLLRFEPRRRRGRSCEGCPDMVGADEDENRRWEMGGPPSREAMEGLRREVEGGKVVNSDFGMRKNLCGLGVSAVKKIYRRCAETLRV